MNESLEISRKDSAMKMTIGPVSLDVSRVRSVTGERVPTMKITLGSLSLDVLLFLCLCLPATVFIGLCTGIILAFDSVLLMLDQIAPGFIDGAWLSLLILYIVLGVAFTYFVARLLRRSFGSEERRVQRRMAILSGFPFYALCLLCLMMIIYYSLFPDAVTGLAAFASVAGFLGFALVSCSYLLLLRFFLRGSIAMLRTS